ncbi:MAG: ABC transporter substrate-binding protein [Rhodovulum sulfidophilum]|uniref:ABC transporter substrate-binding protein n=1 Tax=Rhodovulum sulfidophilum TaxID=35806 RepID=A0A2W5MZF6_RHOSU|nr:MAG: ABC transporter substrate-binding protein [Rhodovulum sulfidophilum]
MTEIRPPLTIATLAVCLLASTAGAFAQSANEVLIVAGTRTPESLDQEYPPTEAGHEARRNIFERLLAYGMKTDESGARVEDFGTIEGRLAESYEVSPDDMSITFHLREGVKSAAGNEMTADDVMWTFERGWNMRATFHWYMTQILKIESFDAFEKIDDHTVRVTVPHPSLLLARLWVNSDLGIIDAAEAKAHVTEDDPWAVKFLSTNSASFAPYFVSRYAAGQEVIYEANPDYYRGEASLKKIIFREMPTSSNRLSALQAGSVDVAEWLTPREIALAERMPDVKVWKVFGNYTQRLEMNNTTAPFDKAEVRQALNYLVPRDEIAEAVYMGTARPTKSVVSEIYPAYTDEAFAYDDDVAKAKELLAAAGYPDGFKTRIGYRTNEPLDEQLAVTLRTSFARAGVEAELVKLPAAVYVERYSSGELPMFLIRDMAIVPDAAYVTNLFINSASRVNYSRYRNEEVDRLINGALTSTDEAAREADMKRAQDIIVGEAPWVFLFNPGYQLATSGKVHGYSWYTPNGNSWYDFSKE